MSRILNCSLIILLCLITITGCDYVKHCPKVHISDYSEKVYSLEEIEELKRTNVSDKITFEKFILDFSDCVVRQTHQGQYAILLLRDNKRAFAFFSAEGTMTNILLVERFISKTEFLYNVVENMSKSEVLRFDPSAINSPISAIDITAHIVIEGVFIVKYDRVLNGAVLEDPIVTSIEFFSNENIKSTEDPFIHALVPFIHEYDKN